MIYKAITINTAYEISECGKSLRRIANGKEVKQGQQIVKGKPSGYLYATLCYDSNNQIQTPKRYAVHRLVAFAWLDNPINDKQVWINHIDGNKANNHAVNLEWTTISQNIQHAYNSGLKVAPSGENSRLYGKKASRETKNKMSAKKLGINHPKFKGYYIANFKRFESANQAGKYLGMQSKTVINRCKNPKFRLQGFYFEPV